MTMPTQAQPGEVRSLIDALLEEQGDLSPVERFARWHSNRETGGAPAQSLRALIPLTASKPGEQYAFEVDLDRCSGCKSCVTACHALNGLDEDETWRSVGLLHARGRNSFQQTITTACHHCVEPGCVEGCPVLAYDKDPLTGIVRHLDDQCIGCQYCIFMCPYEVPKYSERRGIVRKCDMCHQRLAHGEAPACVQACPSEAIRITVVDQETVRNEYRAGANGHHEVPDPYSELNDTRILEFPSARAESNRFLPGSPDPNITLPATRYVSAKLLPKNLMAGDAHDLPLQPAHAPLIWALVLTQLGAGGFAFLPFVSGLAMRSLATIALTATLLGLAGSFLHLGRPRKAWRAFLGLRRSWLSREIVALGIFTQLALATTVTVCLGRTEPVLFWLTSAAGIAAVFCSGMTYHVTGRECWRGELSIGRFFATSAVLGSAAMVFAIAFGGGSVVGPIFVLLLATAYKVCREMAFLRLCPDDADLEEEPPAGLRARAAFLMRFRLGPVLRARLACAWIGGAGLPLLAFLPGTGVHAVAATSLLLCLAGEATERYLFFRGAAVSRMPGSVGA